MARLVFKVEAIERSMLPTPDRQGYHELWLVRLSPVTSPDPEHPNAKFWPHDKARAHSPAGLLQLTCVLPHPDCFPLGAEVYVDVTPVTEPQSTRYAGTRGSVPTP